MSLAVAPISLFEPLRKNEGKGSQVNLASFTKFKVRKCDALCSCSSLEAFCSAWRFR